MAVEYTREEADKLRDRLFDKRPDQWPVLLELAENRCLVHYGFGSLRDFVTAPVARNGLGMTLAQAKSMIQFNAGYKHKAELLLQKLGIEELAQSTDAIDGHGGRRQDNKVKNVMLAQGNAAKYRIAKLKRDHPEVAARLEAGEFKTVSDAERAAGTREKKAVELARFRVFDGGIDGFAEQLKTKLSDKDIKYLVSLL